MFYYRYRPYSELSLKELLYSEMYFTSPEECNDPFDSKAFYKFPADNEKWKKLLEISAKQLRLQIPSELFEKALANICSKCPLTYEKARDQNIFYGTPNCSRNEIEFLRKLGSQIHNTLQAYTPASRYFVSFTTTNDHPLMWSHYADRHKGFCLIFKPIDNGIYQNNKYKRISIKGFTPTGLDSEIGVPIPDIFPLLNINYEPEVQYLNDAFTCLDPYRFGDVKNNEQWKKLNEEREMHYLQKDIVWKYECESRIILPPPNSWQNGRPISYSNQDRLFHYEPTQLVGIILGARMPSSHKERIIEIIHERNRWTKESLNYKRVFFDFVLFDAQMSTTQRKVDVIPSSIISHETFEPWQLEFSKRYEMWNEGWGREVIGKQGTKVRIE